MPNLGLGMSSSFPFLKAPRSVGPGRDHAVDTRRTRRRCRLPLRTRTGRRNGMLLMRLCQFLCQLCQSLTHADTLGTAGREQGAQGLLNTSSCRSMRRLGVKFSPDNRASCTRGDFRWQLGTQSPRPFDEAAAALCPTDFAPPQGCRRRKRGCLFSLVGGEPII